MKVWEYPALVMSSWTKMVANRGMVGAGKEGRACTGLITSPATQHFVIKHRHWIDHAISNSAFCDQAQALN
eukprot:1159649-Pelagomonas_calceolata.AAC.3